MPGDGLDDTLLEVLELVCDELEDKLLELLSDELEETLLEVVKLLEDGLAE